MMNVRFAVLALVLTAQSALAAVIDATVYTTEGEVPLRLEVAADPKSREVGLMNRDAIGVHDGMLFLFPRPDDYRFWMKNTRIPLDMIFIDGKQVIVHIERAVPPYSLAARGADKPVHAIIELDGGRSDREGIAPGDHVRYELPPTLDIR